MAHGFPANIWGFVLDGAPLIELVARFGELTEAGRCDWVLVPVPVRSTKDLRVPSGYHMVPRE